MTVSSQSQRLYFALQQLIFIHSLSRAWNIGLSAEKVYSPVNLSH